MIVTVACDVLGNENNGTSTAAMNLIRYLKSKGHDVRVICPDADKKGEPGYYVVPTMNFHIFNDYVAKNGVTSITTNYPTWSKNENLHTYESITAETLFPADYTVLIICICAVVAAAVIVIVCVAVFKSRKKKNS